MIKTSKAHVVYAISLELLYSILTVAVVFSAISLNQLTDCEEESTDPTVAS